MSSDFHPSGHDLERFMLGELPLEENRRVLRHLLSDCSHCQETTRRLWEVSSGAEEPGVETVAALKRYDTAIDRVFAKVRQANSALRVEREGARALFEELTRYPFERQRLLVQNSTRFQSWGLCELFLTTSQEGRFTDPQEGVQLAEVAVAIAESLAPESYGAALLQDFKARAWAFFGNAKRVLTDFRAADHALQVAESHLARGTGDRLEKARLLDLKASLRNSQGRREEAIALLNRVIGIYQRSQQKHLLGRALLNKGHVFIGAGDFETAIALLRQGLALTDAEREAKLVLTAQHNLAYALNELGQPDEALALVNRARPHYLEFGDSVLLVRLRFLEGKIALGLDQLAEAEKTFREVRQALIERGMAYDAALASLDLAEICIREGRAAEVRRIAEEMVPIFQSRELHREAIAALIMFQKAVEAESVTVSLIHEVAGRLQKIRREALTSPVL